MKRDLSSNFPPEALLVLKPGNGCLFVEPYTGPRCYDGDDVKAVGLLGLYFSTNDQPFCVNTEDGHLSITIEAPADANVETFMVLWQKRLTNAGFPAIIAP